ncbi:MAG TPA: radical SAM family heme chaperone HemW [Terriglobales bacterium]|nr:radical SAM family heme chaperone HemW [Terriglobales bacterium]
MALGLYISVPFCRTKCSFCNFASDVFSAARFDEYVGRVCADIARAEQMATDAGGEFQRAVDSVYLGGGTPSVLAPEQLRRMFEAVRRVFEVATNAEITVEVAPGTLSEPLLATLRECGVNRVSLGVQSFVDEEARAVGRLHTRAIALADIARLRAAGIENLSLDLIAGLPHQTPDSWEQSLAETIATGVPHASVYMLEVDDDSRLGRELIAGGARYHAHHVPDEETTAALYELALERLNAAGIAQYEISNFARAGSESRHNLKYWTRQPYLGFGVDAHSMLCAREGAVRLATPDNLEDYTRVGAATVARVSRGQALEESFFLGLRLNRGVDVEKLRAEFGVAELAPFLSVVEQFVQDGMLEREGKAIRLTEPGRLLSNEVFAEFVAPQPQPVIPSEGRQRRPESKDQASVLP